MDAPTRLKAWRVERGLSQPAAAKLLGISQSALCDYENGRKTPRPGTAARLEEATGIVWAPPPTESGPALPKTKTGT